MGDRGSDNHPEVGTRDKDVPWYSEELKLGDQARELLENYSRIPADEVETHVRKIVIGLLLRPI